MGRETNITDAAGTTAVFYDSCGAVANETVTGALGTKSISRFYDAFGRTTGYSLDGTRQTTLAYHPETGRIASMQTAGAEAPFEWTYLDGSDLKSSLAYPNGVSATWDYDANGKLVRVCNRLAENVISQYDYVNDAIGRRTAITRSGLMMSESRSDYYGYNDRNELTNAVKNATQNEHVYQYDGIGNRLSSLDIGEWREYESNNLNQYASIAEGEDDFAPLFDLDGNQTLVKTSSGVWQVAYNGENRPVSWTCGTTNIVMSFDRMGRRVQYVESVDGVTNSHVTFVYDGYLQIANTDAVAETEQRFVWDPTEPVATRPFVFYSGADTQLYLFAVERCCIEKYANSDDCNCCMRSKATVIARVFWQANNYQFVINEVSAQRKKRMDMTLHRLVDGKTFLLPCKQYKEDHGIKSGKEVMPSTVELKFPPDSIYSR